MINKYITIISLLFALFFVSSTYAAKEEGLRCKATISTSDDFEPETFPRSNNLLRRQGDIEDICGTRIILKGKVVDENCVPVLDAKIFAWQKGCDGKYHYTPLRDVAKNSGLIAEKSKSGFIGAGTASTDNKGEFYLITSFSGHNNNISLRVEHPRFETMETKLFFKNAKATRTPEDFITFLSDPAEGKTYYEFIIVLPGVNKMRSF
ncbi:MAG: dioxygenase [Rickettsiaceae bacterium]|nr:dioxygenase [Rickettsiaceae bacterium]